MATVYSETSIVSYLRQRPSSQVVMAARQLLTHQWWNDERGNYELVTSQYVLDEASAGDPVLAAERLQSLDGIPLLPLDPEIGGITGDHVAADSASQASDRCLAHRPISPSSATIYVDMSLQPC